MRQAKVFARVFDYAGDEPGKLKITIEYRQLQPPYARGKLPYVTAQLVSDATLEDELKLAVARHLNMTQPDLDCRPRDVIGCGV